MRLLLPALLLSLGLLASCGNTSSGSAPLDGFSTVYVTDPDFGDTFEYRSPDSFTYAPGPLAGDSVSTAETAMFTAINAERLRGGTCSDGQSFPPVPALQFEGHLHKSASGYAGVLAVSGSAALPHKTGDSTPVRRMIAAGFVPAPPNRAVLRFEESLAMGMTDPAAVIAAWKTSSRHCAALFSTVSHGAVARADGQLGAYWVLNTAGW
ncbi:CAP domain-containing protein [Deinococcus hopiensis]|uniref:Cysteine-rich secretory protein family protein n=1 Tax=Deinococcus hopiensis KR-140 TaxID=695939 RepID=A0A1W1VQ43_9DEIO|nr:CAP domain-containing protein [Deinococcus hopiensis]SMB95502.1 hypothetical protein SAMN00790413_02866 [Deinococcus hopiensis KR-140]